MHDDVGERVNLQGQNLEVVTNLTRLLEKYVAAGRSSRGSPQKNDVLVNIWKSDSRPLNNKNANDD